MSHAQFCADSGHIICAPITGAKKSRWPFDTIIENWKGTGLPIPSVIGMKMFTLDSKRVLRKASVLDAEAMRKVESVVGGLLV